MKKSGWPLLLVLLFTPVVAAAQVPQPQRERRALEAQIVQRFLDHTATQLQLDTGSRTRLEQHLRSSAPRRRALAQNTVELRGELLRAVRDENTSDAEFRRLLGEMTKLRDQEEQLWKADQEALGRILTPRQHARFVIMWLRFNEQIRDVAERRPPPAGVRRP